MKNDLRSIVTAVLIGCAFDSSNAGVISTVAGTGSRGFSGDGQVAMDAKLNDPTGVTRGPDGALYFCDTANHRIRKVSTNATISTVVGSGEAGWAGDGGPALKAKLNEPYEVRFDQSGNMFWVERNSHSVRRLDVKSGLVSTVAGNGTAGFAGDSGLAIKARLNEPHSIAIDKAGDLYIADVRNHRVRKVDMKTGKISTFAGTGEKKGAPDDSPFATSPLSGPRALDFDSAGNLWVALREGNAVVELKVAKGTLRRVAGTGTKGFTGNGGPARLAALNGPKGISVSVNGDIYIADTENHAVRVIYADDETIHTVAGTGISGDGPDGNPLECRLARPHGVFVDRNGEVFIGDSGGNRVRVLRQNH